MRILYIKKNHNNDVENRIIVSKTNNITSYEENL